MAAIAVIGIYWVIASTADSELGSRTPAEDYYNRLSDGFAKGQLSLDLAPPPGLAQLSDPYDPRQNAPFHGQAYLPGRFHDLSYYRGKLYLYFSAVPAVVLFLPFHWLTGAYLSHQQACFLFCSIGFLEGVTLVGLIRRRCFPLAGAAAMTVCTLCLGLVPLVPIVLQRPDVWEIPITAGYAFWMLALLLVWVDLQQPRQSWKTALGISVAVGLAIGCRPNSCLGGAILLWPLLRPSNRGGLKNPQNYALIAALLLPVLVIGAGLLAYNAARFGSPFDFGQKYQLTGDIERSIPHFDLGFLWYNFRLYFLEYPGWQHVFPFVRDLSPPRQPVGHIVVESPVGVLTLLPFILCAAAIPFGLGQSRGSERKLLAAIVGALLLVFVSEAGPLCLFFATCVRYQLEFVPPLVLGAAIGFLALATGDQERRWMRWSRLAAANGAAAASIAFNLLMAANHRGAAETQHGVIAMQSGHPDQAAALFRRAMQLRPANVVAPIGLSNLLVREGKFDEASVALGRAIVLLPGSANLHLNYAYSLVRLGRLREALAECDRALEIQPDFADAKNADREIRRRLPGGS